MNDKLKAVGAAALLLVVVLASFSMAATAAHDAANNTEYHNATYAVDNDTRAVYLDVEDTNGTNVHAYFYAIDDGGNLTEVHNETMAPASGAVASTEVTVDAGNYSEYRVVLEGDGTTEAPVDVESGLVKALAGGGGISLNSTFLGMPLYGVLVLVLVIGGVGVAVATGEI